MSIVACPHARACLSCVLFAWQGRSKDATRAFNTVLDIRRRREAAEASAAPAPADGVGGATAVAAASSGGSGSSGTPLSAPASVYNLLLASFVDADCSDQLDSVLQARVAGEWLLSLCWGGDGVGGVSDDGGEVVVVVRRWC